MATIHKWERYLTHYRYGTSAIYWVKGIYIDHVRSLDRNAYPDDNRYPESDNVEDTCYWYVYVGTEEVSNSAVHKWEKYALDGDPFLDYFYEVGSVKLSSGDKIAILPEPHIIDSTYGRITSDNLITATLEQLAANTDSCRDALSDSRWFSVWSSSSNDNYWYNTFKAYYYEEGSIGSDEATLYYTGVVEFVSFGKGTYIETVESDDPSTYRENGRQDGYWYVYIGTEGGEEANHHLYATVDGVQRELTKLPAMVDGVQRELSSLFATIDSVARLIFSAGISGKALSSYSTGDIVYLNENGTPTAFYVAGHNYESGLNGAGRTLLVRKDAHERRQWHTSQGAIQYSQSSVDAYLTGTYHLLFSDSVRSLMGETTIYSTTASGTSITIKRPVFLLSAREVIPEGYNVYSGLYSEGSPVPLSADCFFFIINSMWGWLRTKGTSTANAGYLGSEGDSSILMNNTANIYPALTLPSTANFDPSTDILLEGANDSPSNPPSDPPSDLPSGYTKANYIQSSTTAYFNTNYVPTHNTRVVLKCKILEVTGNGWVFGSRTSSQSNQFDLFCETGGTSWRVGIGNKQTMWGAGTFLGEYTFDISKDGAYVNGVKTDVTYGEFTGAQPIYLCGGNNGGTFFTGGHIIQQVEECQILESGVLVHDYVPCKNASGVFGLYDKVAGTFGGSSGSGAFTGG